MKRLHALAVLTGFLALEVLAWTGPDPSGNPLGTRIDAHVHVFDDRPEFFRLLRRLDLKVVNICVVDKHDKGFEEAEPQHTLALGVFKASQGRAPWCATFDPQAFESATFVKDTIARLEAAFDQGAVAVKIYKSIGMELKSKSGKYIMPDEPVFEPILKFIESRNKTLYAHIAEPSAAWKPLDPSSPHYGYYKNNPDWHVYRVPGFPSKETILRARDRVLKLHPKLRVVGCHLGSMEDDVGDIARRFDEYPNFAVDAAARIPDLMIQPREKVRGFFVKYQDRLLYATDLSLMQGEEPEARLKRWEQTYARDWTYFATADTVEFEGRQVRGLKLPEPVLRKLFRENAVRWVPGIVDPPKRKP